MSKSHITLSTQWSFLLGFRLMCQQPSSVMRKYICLLSRERRQLDSSLNSFLECTVLEHFSKKGKLKGSNPEVNTRLLLPGEACFTTDSISPVWAEAAETLVVTEQRSQRLVDTHSTLRNKCLAGITSPFCSLDFILNPFIPVPLKLIPPFGRDASLCY